MKKILSLLLWLMLLCSVVTAVSLDAVHQTAVSEYRNKQFDKALANFSFLEKSNIHNPDLYYNIANCYFKMNRIGLAVLYYKKALLLNSSHRLARKNLNFALKFTRDKQSTENQNFLTTLILSVYNSLSLNILSWILLILIAIIAFLWFKLIRKKTMYEITIKFLIVNTAIIAFFFLIWCGMRFYHYENNNEAVVLASIVNGYSGPGEDFTKLFTIHEGLIIKLVKQNEGWTQISLPNGLSGWVRSSVFRSISSQD